MHEPFRAVCETKRIMAKTTRSRAAVTASVPAVSSFVAQSRTPHNRCVRFMFGFAAALRNTRLQAARYGLTRAGLPPADRASFRWRLPPIQSLYRRARSARRKTLPARLVVCTERD
jgi:hypothetical protein